jgi:hypothetical protein
MTYSIDCDSLVFLDAFVTREEAIRACMVRDVGDLQCSADLEAQPHEVIQGSSHHASLFVSRGFLSSEYRCW